MPIRPPVLHVAAVIALLLVAYLLVYLGVASKSVGSALAFVAIIGGIGVWFFRSARHR